MERKSPMSGEIYRHFKNKLYQIVGVAEHSESREKLVIYQALYGNFGMYARPYDMFMSEVDHKKYPEVQQKYRFEKAGIVGENICSTVAVNKNEDNLKITLEDVVKTIPDKAVIEGATDVNSDVEEQEGVPNPDLLAFLDAETYEEKHKLLVAMRPRITDRLINDLAAAIDVTVEDGDLETRFKSLLYCVKKMDEFEVTRLR